MNAATQRIRELTAEILALHAELKPFADKPPAPLSRQWVKMRRTEGKILDAVPTLARAAMALVWEIEEEEEEEQVEDELAGPRLLTSDCVEGRHDECDDEGSAEPMEVCGCPCHGQYGSMCRKCWRERTAGMDSDPRSRLPKRVRAHKGECKFCTGRLAREKMETVPRKRVGAER